MEILIPWVLLSILVAVLAGKKGRSWFGWLLLSLLLTPIVGLIAVLVVKPATPKVTPTATVQDDRRFYVDVVGESHYQANLERICGKRKENGEHLVTQAQLVPETDNPYDPNAVRVEINGLPVGHLAREAAVAYRSLHSGPLTCEALIAGGWLVDEDEEPAMYGVKLNLPK